MDSASEVLAEVGPDASILMLAYNRAATIIRAISSVQAQTFQDWELILVDDGSTDDTATLVRSLADPRIRYIRHTDNAGVIVRRNEAVRESRGAYIALLDSDDEWIDPRKLERQIRFLDQHPNVVVVGTQARIVRGTASRITHYPVSDRAIRARLLSKNVFVNSSCMIRASMLDPEPYHSDDYLVEDYGLWLRLGLRGALANLPECTVAYYEHPSGQNASNRRLATERSALLVRSFRTSYPGYFYACMQWNLKRLLRSI